ncbi:hypothetical protein CaCOL14_002724 [Colletotrichum acutatum]
MQLNGEVIRVHKSPRRLHVETMQTAVPPDPGPFRQRVRTHISCSPCNRCRIPVTVIHIHQINYPLIVPSGQWICRADGTAE